MNVNERIEALRKVIADKKIDTVFVLSQDAHQSEYVAPYWRARAYISGFTGSAGVFAATKERSAVWVDGRYFLQGEEQTKDSEVELMKIGEPGVPNYVEWIIENTPEGGTVAVDGRTIGCTQVQQLKKQFAHKNITLLATEDPVGEVWTDRPSMPKEPIFELPLCFAGKSRAEKLSELRAFMKKQEDGGKNGADYYLIASLESTAWLLNIRCSDIDGTPVAYAFTLVGKDSCDLFIDEDKVPTEMKQILANDKITIKPYDALPTTMQALGENKSIAFDGSLINELLMESIPESWTKLMITDAVIAMKGVKNPVERENVYKAHVKDGAVMAQFIKWLKQAVKVQTLTECDIADHLDQLRKDQPNSLGISFTTIAGYGKNGAIVHYSPERGSCAELKPEGLVLVDSGAQYMEGTTDITRTIALGELTEEMKECYTLVLKGHLQLGHARFPEHISGTNLDILARKPLWDRALDYKHGTGHGVGFVLGVHEGPMSISYGRNNVTLVPGMLISDEPGFYPTGKFGIRIENLVMVEPWCENEWGKFDRMQAVTLCPYERAAIKKELLSEEEIAWVNEYHQRVYEEVSGLLDDETRAWLKEETRPL